MLAQFFRSIRTALCFILFITVSNLSAQIQFNVQTPSPFASLNFAASQIADMDNDGLNDLVLAGRDANGILTFSLFTNQGGGSFTETPTSVLEAVGVSLNIVDIDNDNDLDIFITGTNDQGTNLSKLFINELVPSGTISFSESTESFLGIADGTSTIADFDNNGMQDVFISGSTNQGNVSKLYLQSTAGSFSEVPIGIPGYIYNKCGSGDFNNDGWTDLIVGGLIISTSDETEIYLNDQNGGFISSQTLPTARNGSIDIGDLNGDGLVDLAITGGNYGGGHVYMNNPSSPGTFVQNSLIMPAFYFADGDFSDFDSDGDLDMVFSGVNYNTFYTETSIYENDGSGNFTLLSTGSSYSLVNASITTGDLLGNANPEIYMTGADSPFSGYGLTSALFENIGPVECIDDDGDGICNDVDPCPNNAGATLDDCGNCVGGDTGLNPCSAQLVLTPSDLEVTPCEEFTILVSVTNNSNVNVVEAYLNFDNTKLEVTGVSEAPGNPLEMDILPASYDNAQGTISYIASTITPSSSNFDFLEITFQSLATSGSTTIDPKLSGDPNCSIIVTQNIGGIQTPIDILSDANSVNITLSPDATPPIAVCQDLSIQLDESGTATITAADLDNGSSDVCSSISLSIDQENFDCSDVGANTITLTVTDAAGNTSTCTSTVTVEDNITPSIACPASETIYANASCNITLNDYTSLVSSGDNCSVNITQTPVAGTQLTLGTTPVTLSATDAAGNFTSCSFNITVEDDTNPTISCPGDQTVYVDETCSALLLDYTNDAIASDNCNVTVSQIPAAGSPIGLGTNQVTLTATDGAGNTAICTFNVIVQDNTIPTISCPPDQIVYVNGGCSISLDDYTSEAVADDNCSVSISQSPAAGTSLSLGNTLITLTATDGAGNSTNCSFNVSVEDNTNPTVSCPGDQTVFTDASCEATLSDYTSIALADDNCSISISQNPVAGTVITPGLTPVTITATDGSGNIATCTFNVTVEDNIAPTITCPPNETIYADASCTATLDDYTTTAVANDNCSVLVSQSPTPGTNLILGVTTVTLTATDDAGNSASCQFDVTLEDNTAPTLSCPSDINLPVNASCSLILGDYTAAASVSDNCSVTVTQSPLPGTSLGLGSTPVTLTATDAAGNSTDCTFTVTAFDDTRPTISCPGDDIVLVDASCSSTLADYTSMAVADDNCSVSVTQSPLPGTSIVLGMTNITLTATDGAGNTASCTFVVRVQDNTDPNIICPGNQTVSVDGNCSAVLADYTSMSTVDDNCSATVTQTPAPGTTIGLGSTTVTLTATDNSGNSSSCSFDVSVEDNTPPTIVCPADEDIFVDAACNISLPDYTSQVSADDNCAYSITQSPSPGTSIGLGNTEVTISATDDAGNSTSCSFTVSAIDNVNPIISCPSDITLSVGGSCQITLPDYRSLAVANDNCDVTVSQAPVAGTAIGLGDTQVVLTATDGAGNTSTCTFNVTVEDSSAPTIVCPGNKTVLVDAACTAVLIDYTAQATANDNCSVTVSQSPVAGTAIGLGTTTVTLTASDASGNISSCTFDVNVEDNIDPSIICPSNETIYVDASCSATLNDYTSQAAANDNCSVLVTQSPLPGSSIGLGTTTVTLTAEDNAGNTANCSFTVTVEDNTAPTITCPTDQTVYVESSCSALLSDYTSAITANDNCSVTVTQSPVAGSSLSLGTTSVTLTATDNAGNSTMCTFNVSVEDNTPPTISCLDDLTVTADGSCTYTVGDYTSVITAEDNCSVNVTQTPEAGTAISVGTTGITLTATDNAGNTSNCTFNIIVEDNAAPSIECAENATRSINQSNGTYLVSGGEFDATASDNCGNITISHDAGSIPGAISTGDNTSLNGWGLPTGIHLITFTVDDGNGNTTSCQVEITIQGITISGTFTLNLNCAPFDLRVRLYEPGTTTLVAEQVTTIDSNGDYSAEFSSIAADDYDVYLKVERYLQQGYPNQDLTGGGAIINPSNLLNGDVVGGSDNFNDNYIGLDDLTYVIGIVFNNLFGEDQYEARADLNCDNQVDALDLSLILFNFNSSGDAPE